MKPIQIKTRVQLSLSGNTASSTHSSIAASSVKTSCPKTLEEIITLMTKIAFNEIREKADGYSGQPDSVTKFLNERVPAITANLAQTFELMRSQILANISIQQEIIDPLGVVETLFEHDDHSAIAIQVAKTPLKDSTTNAVETSNESSEKASVEILSENYDTTSNSMEKTKSVLGGPSESSALETSNGKSESDKFEILTLKKHVEILDDLDKSQKSDYIEKLSKEKCQITSIEILPPISTKKFKHISEDSILSTRPPKRANRYIPIIKNKKNTKSK